MTLYIVFFLMTLNLIGLVVCFILFCHYRNFSFRDIMAPLKFFDFCFFERGTISNSSIVLLLFTYIFGIALSVVRGDGFSFILSNAIGVLSIILFILHCRFLSKRRFLNVNGIEFLKEFFFERKVNTHNLLLWLARFLYIFWIYRLVL